MAKAKVHYFDHRSGERVSAIGDHWHGAFWWSEGNGSSDRNRSVLMYGENKERWLCENFELNLIRIEKIVCRGKIVYKEALHALPLSLVAAVVAANELSLLCDLCESVEHSKVVEWKMHFAELLKAKKLLASYSDEAQAVDLLDHCVQQLHEVLGCIDTCTEPAPMKGLMELRRLCLNFRRQTNEKCRALRLQGVA